MKVICLAISLVCTVMLSAQEIADTAAHTQELQDSFGLYPNPAVNDVVYVTTRKNDAKSIVIFDVFGKVVLRDRITTTALNIAILVPGVYVLQVQENDKKMTRKLVVK
jgi:hypothetical protein